MLSGGSLLRVRTGAAWRSATAGVAGPDSYSPFGYANVLRHVLANVLGSQRYTSSTEAHSATDQLDVEADHAHIEVRTDVVEPVESYLYRPAGALWLWLAAVPSVCNRASSPPTSATCWWPYWCFLPSSRP